MAYHYEGVSFSTTPSNNYSILCRGSKMVAPVNYNLPGYSTSPSDQTKPIQGTNNSETIYGTAGDDIIRGYDGNDHLYGLGGSDLMAGYADNNTLDGGEGNDFLFTGNGYNGTDTLIGGAGYDQFVYNDFCGNAPGSAGQYRHMAIISDFQQGVDKIHIVTAKGYDLNFAKLDTNGDGVLGAGDVGIGLGFDQSNHLSSTQFTLDKNNSIYINSNAPLKASDFEFSTI
ncbi:hypothetical protein AB1E22_20335 [Buttiauxella gaviniae]|uniref:Calcium-binding protein n=1 Tax=Buttiauxella gaviniae TaxID=82990 RepID=A0ABV3NZN8_9ENTR